MVREFARRFLLWVCVAVASAADEQTAGSFATAIEAAQARVVKIHAAGIGTIRSYASGVVVSSDGRIVTALSVMLEDPAMRVILPDGRRFPARVVARDDTRQLAELRIETTDLLHFELGTGENLKPGDWLIAAANPFKVAEGSEPISVIAGVLAERTSLAARARTQDFSYQGPVLLVDAIVSTPGCPGGALVDLDGRLVGVIGKSVVSTRTNTLANYAMPVEEVAAFLDRRPAGDAEARADSPTSAPAAATIGDWGIRLLDVGGRVRPAYVERVRPDSAAARAGLRADDLILSINGDAVSDVSEVQQAIAKADRRRPVVLVVKRHEEIVTVELTEGG